MSIVEKIRKYKAVISIFVVACLVISGFYVYFEFFAKEQIVEEITVKEVDDDISPLTQQALFVQIIRIRRKGIIDQMMCSGTLVNLIKNLPINNKEFKLNGEIIDGAEIIGEIEGRLPGKGWDKKPYFSYIAVLDGYEWKGRKVYNTWDTDYLFKEFYKVVGEEQPTAEIEFKFVETEEIKKLFGSNVKEKEMDSFKVVYDFRTGRWDGGDSFNDSDGYRHFNGTNYEMWFDIRQTDYDGDGIPYWTEVNVLETDPVIDDSKLDPDGDGCPTAWEWKWGYDPVVWDNHTFLDPDGDGLQNVEEYYMCKWLANPYYPEIYIEADWSDKAPFKPFAIEWVEGKILSIKRPKLVKTGLLGNDHVFWEDSQQMLMDRFSQHGITVIIDDGCIDTAGKHGGGEILPFLSGEGVNTMAGETGTMSQYYNSNFDDDRKGIFRYLIFAHGGGYTYNMDIRGCYDTMIIQKTRNFFKGVGGGAMTPRTQRISQAVAVMHELGHTCGIAYEHCGGVDNFSSDGTWKNYMSCMYYIKYSQRLFDYSDGSHGENDADDWSSLDLAHFEKPSFEMEGVSFDPAQVGRERG